jgi:hypothetical protein
MVEKKKKRECLGGREIKEKEKENIERANIIIFYYLLSEQYLLLLKFLFTFTIPPNIIFFKDSFSLFLFFFF